MKTLILSLFIVVGAMPPASASESSLEGSIVLSPQDGQSGVVVWDDPESRVMLICFLWRAPHWVDFSGGHYPLMAVRSYDEIKMIQLHVCE